MEHFRLVTDSLLKRHTVPELLQLMLSGSPLSDDECGICLVTLGYSASNYYNCDCVAALCCICFTTIALKCPFCNRTPREIESDKKKADLMRRLGFTGYTRISATDFVQGRPGAHVPVERPGAHVQVALPPSGIINDTGVSHAPYLAEFDGDMIDMYVPLPGEATAPPPSEIVAPPRGVAAPPPSNWSDDEDDFVPLFS